MIEPIAVSSEDLVAISKSRNQCRIPTLSWYNQKAGIYRAAQTSDNSLRCLEDETFVEFSNIKIIIEVNYKQSGKSATKEIEMPNYQGTQVISIKFPDINKLKTSFEQLKALYERKDYFFTVLHHSRWLHYIKDILSVSLATADYINYEKCSVLITCQDGWDYTPSITSIAELLLDPFYRSYQGFQVLISKEWLSLGHKFKDRLYGSERSPVFIQFLDAVHQILRQFPNEFEFNDKYILFIADGIYSGLYGTFMANCESELEEFKNSSVSI